LGLRSLIWVIEKLVPDGLWERIAPLLSPPKPRHITIRVAGRSTTARRWPGSCSCSGPGPHGTSYRPHWSAAGLRA